LDVLQEKTMPNRNPLQTLAGLVYDDRYLQHNTGLEVHWGTNIPYPFVEPALHLSNYRLVMRTKHLIDRTGLGKDLARIEPYLATAQDVTVYHTAAYVELVRQICAAGGGDTGEGAIASPESYEIALLAVGGGMAAVDAVVDGRVRRVFANVRPPGHHAMADKGMGYCIFNNVVIAARHAQRRHGLDRVLIVDWDVHDGNGTQDAFYADPSVLFVSLHQDRLYPPGFGELGQVGDGDGTGYTVNIPLPAGSGDATYQAAFERVVLPIARQFRPELVLVSAGQDASIHDQLGRMSVTTEGYRAMTQAMIDVAEEFAGGRLVILQEGGYSELYSPYCTFAIVETLAERRTGFPEPLTADYIAARVEHTTVGPSGEAALTQIVSHHAQYWSGLIKP
jgi:acetoin utilization deacetylase AcuC-like enzyme